MTIKDELDAELRDAMKSGDTRRRDVIRQIKTEVATATTQPDHDGVSDDSLYVRTIASYVKKMDKSRAEYESYGDRGREMSEKLEYEVGYLSRWLPKTLGEGETRELVRSAIAELGVDGDEKAAGRVIGHVMKSHGKDLDGALVNQVVREILSSD